MTSIVLKAFGISLIVLAPVLCVPPCVGQTYPYRSIRFVVPLPPGWGADIVARTVGQKLNRHLSNASRTTRTTTNVSWKGEKSILS